MTVELLEKLDARAESLGLNRSQYLAQLARADLVSGGALTLHADIPAAVLALNEEGSPYRVERKLTKPK